MFIYGRCISSKNRFFGLFKSVHNKEVFTYERCSLIEVLLYIIVYRGFYYLFFVCIIDLICSIFFDNLPSLFCKEVSRTAKSPLFVAYFIMNISFFSFSLDGVSIQIRNTICRCLSFSKTETRLAYLNDLYIFFSSSFSIIDVFPSLFPRTSCSSLCILDTIISLSIWMSINHRQVLQYSHGWLPLYAKSFTFFYFILIIEIILLMKSKN